MKNPTKNRLILPVLLAAAFLTFFAWTSISAGSLFSFGSKSESSNHADSGILGVEHSSPGDVTVNLKPLEFENGQLEVRISINTHTVDDLDKYDLSKLTRLITGDDSIEPVSVPRLGGHHNNGRLVFELERLPKQFTILIEGLHSDEIRRFEWP